MSNSEVAAVVTIADGTAVLAFLRNGRVFHGKLQGRGGAVEWFEVDNPVPGTDAGGSREDGGPED